MGRRLQESFPFYREKFILSLLKSSHRPNEELHKKLAYFQLDELAGPSICLVISLDDYDTLSEREEQGYANMYRLKAKDLLEGLMHRKGKHLFVEAEDDTIVCLTSIETNSLEDVFLIAEEMLNALKEALGGSFSIGIGNPAADIHGVPHSFQEAAESLRYRYLYGSNQVIFFRDVSLQQGESREWFDELAGRYISYVKLNQLQGILISR